MTWVGDLLRAGINAAGSTITFDKPVEFAAATEFKSGITVPDGSFEGDSLALPALKIIQKTVTFADFDEAATSVVLDSGEIVPKGALVLRTLLDNVTKFEGGDVSAATLTLGDSDGAGGTTDADRYNTGTPNVFADADVLDAGVVSGTALHTADAEVALTLGLTGGNGDDLTAGEVTFTIFYLQGVLHAAE